MGTRILVPSGVLGLGFDPAALQRGVERNPDAICIDGGSTDSGPFYLGSGTTKYAASATRSQWKELLIAREQAGVPLILGTSGTCGVDAMVDWMAAMTDELLLELGFSAHVACVYSEQAIGEVLTAFQNNRVKPLPAAQSIDEQTLGECAHIVALAGVEPLQSALKEGVDIVIAGRTTDTAVIAAVPLMRGEHPGASWHAAKIAECGALCSTHPTSGVIEVDIDHEGFTVRALADEALCTPQSVAAHMLYENSDPIQLLEPGGMLDVSHAQYEALDDGVVRVTGSEWVVNDTYTVKLEGSRLAGYQSTVLAMLRNARYVSKAKDWLNRLSAFLENDIQQRMQLQKDQDYTLEFRLIGVDSVLGELEHRKALPVEVGVLALVTATSDELADDIARLINPFVLHYPLTDDEELPTFAFPYSPAQSNRGALYEFTLNHVMTLESANEAFRLQTKHLGVDSAPLQNEVKSARSYPMPSPSIAESQNQSKSKSIENAIHTVDVNAQEGGETSSSLAGKTLGDIVQKVRSKNAGPFWVTVDIFCSSEQSFHSLVKTLSSAAVAACFQVDPSDLKRFNLDELRVVKFSFPRAIVQGDRFDRDMHGAQYAERLVELLL